MGSQVNIYIGPKSRTSDVDPHWSFVDPQNLMNADPDPEQ